MIIVALAVLGLILGSFVSAVVWRLHEQSKPKKRRTASDEDLSIATGRSMCPHCKHTLGALDLIPVLSWLYLRGKCRYCHQPIDDTPLPEVGLAAIFVFSYIFWPYGFEGSGLLMFGIWLLSLVGLMALAIYDLRWMLLPNKIVYPLIGLTALGVLARAALFEEGMGIIVSAVLAMAVAGGIFYVLFYASGGRWIGGGDVKLGFALGLLLMYPLKALLMLFVASLLGTLVALPLMYGKKLKRTSHVPFGPFLIAATVIAQLFGDSIINWYDNLLFPL